MNLPPIFVIDGAPGVGKSTLSRALMAQFERGLHVEVDVLREWVVSGIAHPMHWNEETARQFRLAEHSAVDLAIRYQDAGFAVVIDHCRRLEDWDEILGSRLMRRPLVKILLVAGLETNLARNRQRTNKDFDTAVLEPIIKDLSVALVESAQTKPSWHVVHNGQDGIEAAVDAVLALLD